MSPSFRAQLVTRRTYNRPLNEDGTEFETWDETVDRVIQHQAWLWERAQGHPLLVWQHEELDVLRNIIRDRKAIVAGRTLWLGGTEVAKRRESSNFNCSFSRIEDVYDVVDCYWLLLQGCGVGFHPVPGILNGFTRPLKDFKVVRSEKQIGDPKGREETVETLENGVWHITLGDSAEAWAKLPGKLLAQKATVDTLILDFSEIRAAGERLRGYGWLSSGDVTISRAMIEIVNILNNRAGELLSVIDILDVMNWLGTTLSSRRSAEIAVLPFHDPEAGEFANAKANIMEEWHRGQSNNSLLFYERPSKLELEGIFAQMIRSGGSEPGFINAAEASRRGPWFKGVNPCCEIILGHKSFCNLVDIDMSKFVDDFAALQDVAYYIARANYRQTCVNLKDGILSDSWHELNEFLRLCGVGLTGIVKWMDQVTDPDEREAAFSLIREEAREGAYQMADELGLPNPKAVTTVKPSGTMAKVMDTTEGAHRPIGKYIFNKIQFSAKDPLVPMLREANYEVIEHPYDPESSVLVTIPVEYENVEFTSVNGLEVNQESAIEQLERYKLLMTQYVDHNASITVYYDPSEVHEIVEWLYNNWDNFVGVSWLFRDDPTKTAEDLGYPYLPQKVVDKETYETYVATLKPIDIDKANSFEELTMDDCDKGGCPIR